MPHQGDPISEGSRAYLVVVPDASSRASEGIDLFALLRSGWRTMLALTAIGGALALVVGFVTPKVYRAQVTVAPVSAESQGGLLAGLQSQLGGLAGLAGLNFGKGDSSKQESLARLVSRDFTYRFISDERLLPILFADRWDPAAKAWRVDEQAPSLEEAYLKFHNEIRTVSDDRVNGLVRVSIDWTNPTLAAHWANSLVDRINSDTRAAAIAEAERSIQYLERESAKTSVLEVRESIYRLIESQVQKIMLANVRDQYAFKVIDRAYEPSEKGVVRPRRALLLVLGLIFGSIAGFALVLLRREPGA